MDKWLELTERGWAIIYHDHEPKKRLSLLLVGSDARNYRYRIRASGHSARIGVDVYV